MDEKVEILLNKINIDKEHYQYFSDAKMSKIKIKDDIGYKKIYMGWNKEAYISKIAEEFKEYIIKNINQW